jgi:hypothetical protein
MQIAVATGSLVPILAGLAGVVMGPSMLGDTDTANLSFDSHFRYLSGLLVGIGLGFCSTISTIERKTGRFQLLAAIVFIGGLGRVTSLWTVGMPDHGMLFGLAMELIVTPLLAWGQYQVARRYAV